ncbi:transcriptional repressor, CopY family [Pseudofrankia inefficax]|uniref:Transcriptional repressor, CopY family n=1 Tax=Pseudofrankia inefficax (strain DSM 45817 / CECT 9037 / DDB 130130 / EuI1c) TaxID=298654 RepID=E3ITQ8_PSEI1|nr:transcriptional repressor, CopY family [Pseudofrankia inefficax]
MVVGVVSDADANADDAGDDRLGGAGLLDESRTEAGAYGADDLEDHAGALTGLELAVGAGRGRRRSPGSLEAEILTVLHTARRELSPAQVRERLNGGPALSYSAVVTTLTRLHGKGVVTRRRAGRAFLYVAQSDAASLVAWRMNRLLDEQADHRPALTHFVAALSPGDEALIRQLLAEGSAGHGGGAERGWDGSAQPPDARDGRRGHGSGSGGIPAGR